MKRKLMVKVAVALITSLILITLPKHKLSHRESGRTVILELRDCRIRMDLEQFIPLVLMAEMPYDSPKELLKAQAVVVRTNILYGMGGKKEVTAEETGLPYKTPEQLKSLWFEEEKVQKADEISGMVGNLFGWGAGEIFTRKMNTLYDIIGETEGRVLKIQGKLILPLFHRLSNGKNRDGKEVLGEKFSYLLSKDCQEDMEASGYNSFVELSVKEIFDSLEKRGIVVFQKGSEVEGKAMMPQVFMEFLKIEKTDSKGYINVLSLGDVKVDGMDFAKALGLKSPAFDVSVRDEKIVFSVRGDGHGLGMSLHQAEVMAKQGKTYREILVNFYDAALVKNMD